MTTEPHPAFLGDKIAWDRDRLVVTSPELLEKINRPHLSPSTAKSMHGCPAKMVAERSRPKTFDLFSAPDKGTAAHAVLEELYALPPERRDAVHAARILVELGSGEPVEGEVDYAREIGTDPVRYAMWIAAVTRGYSGIFAIEDPKTVNVYEREMRLDGVEVGGVPFKGFIDRIDEMPDDSFRVVDFKTGKDKSKPNLRFDDDHGDQGRLYKAAFEALTGNTVKHVYMYYIEHGKQRRVAISQTDVRKTVRGFVASWKDLQSAVAKAEFVARPSALCGWCPLANSCPVAKPASNENDPRASAASAVDLGIPVLRPVSTSVPESFTDVPFCDEPPAGMFDDHGLGQVPEPPADLDPALVDAAVEQTLHGGAAAAHVSTKTTDAEPEGTTMSTRREGKAWEPMTPDGLNLNSYAAMAVIGLSSLAAECLNKGGQKVGPSALTALTGVLAKVVLDAQASVTNGSRDWSEGANTRVRGALRTFIDSGIAPMPFGGSTEDWTKWQGRAVAFSVAVVKNGISLFDGALEVDMTSLIAAAPAADEPAAEPAAA